MPNKESTQEKILQLDPEMQSTLVTLLQLAEKEHPEYDWSVAQGLRSSKAQDELFAQGPTVTRARGGKSMHNYGVAADVYPLVNGRIPTYEEAKTAYDYMGKLANDLNLTWGGTKDWGGPEGDYGHLQLNFDPDGRGYDYQTAIRAGMVPPVGQHFPTREPRSMMILKGRQHPTFMLGWRQRPAGFEWIKGLDGRYYSVPTNSKEALK